MLILLYYLRHLTSVSPLIPLFVGLSKIKLYSVKFKLIYFYSLISLITEYICFFHLFNSKNNNLIIHLFTFFEFISISFFYYKAIQQKFIKTLILIINILNSSYFFYSLINSHSYSIYIESTIESIIFVILSISYYYFHLNYFKSNELKSIPEFWIITAFFVYFQGMMLLDLFGDYFLHMYPSYKLFELRDFFHSLFNISMYVIIAIGFRKIETS